MNKRRVMAAVLVGVMGCSMIGCSGDKTADTTTSVAKTETTTALVETKASEAAGAVAGEWKPERSINAEIGYAAGGSTDSALRPLFSIAEGIIGQTITVNNTSGASGSTSFQAAMEQAADGYTLVIGAETPALFDAFDLSDYTYDDTEIIMVVASANNNIFVKADSPYQTIEELIDAEVANPGSIVKVASGTCGTNANNSAIIKYFTGADFTAYTADGSSSAVTTVLGGFADFGMGSLATLGDYIESGEIRVLCTVDKERIRDDIPCITEYYPEMEEYLPNTAFYAITVKEGTDPAIIEYYTEVFQQAFESSEYQDMLANVGLTPLGLIGDEAREYIDTYRKNSISVLYDTGAITSSPADLGIE